MADDTTFSADSIAKYLKINGGKVSNHELVKHFKKFLSGPDSQQAKAQFKEYVNSVASMKVEDGVKYVLLKRPHDSQSSLHTSDNFSCSSETDTKKFKPSEELSVNNGGFLHSHSASSFLGMDSTSQPEGSPITPGGQSPSVFWSSDLPPGHVPQPPPRRKHSLKGKENRGAKFEESIRQINEERESATSPKNEDLQVVSPGSVKEKATFLNKMASELDQPQKPSVPSRRRDHPDKGGYDDDTCSVSTLDPRRREWIVKAAQADYHELVRLLREEPRLAHVKDQNKYTALHWGAKHGNLNVIKLIAGTHKVDTNMKSGYTPLHLAAMFGREEIMEVLINTYGADPGLRDYSGKKALNYLPKNQVERFLTLFPSLSIQIRLCGKPTGKSDKDPALMRIGSLNSKTKRTSVLSAGRALTRMKSWGSADNIPDRATNLMPPPKTFPKKKKSRKYADIVVFSEHWRGKSPDSDSDSASGVAQ